MDPPGGAALECRKTRRLTSDFGELDSTKLAEVSRVAARSSAPRRDTARTPAVRTRGITRVRRPQAALFARKMTGSKSGPARATLAPALRRFG